MAIIPVIRPGLPYTKYVSKTDYKLALTASKKLEKGRMEDVDKTNVIFMLYTHTCNLTILEVTGM